MAPAATAAPTWSPNGRWLSQFRFNRYEFYAQDSWRGAAEPYARLRPALRAASARHRQGRRAHELRARAVQCGRCSTAQCHRQRHRRFRRSVERHRRSGSELTSTTGRSTKLDKNNLQPRVGAAWDINSDGRMVMRGGYGIYYDQPLVGTFLQNAHVNATFCVRVPEVLNAQLSNPGSGITPTASAGDELDRDQRSVRTPRTQQWNVGLQRQLYARGVVRCDLRRIGRRQPHSAGPDQPATAAGRGGSRCT